MSNVTIDPTFDDNAYLKYLPPHLRERYQQALEDPELTHLSRQIALMDVRIKVLLENLDRQVLTQEQIAEELKAEFPQLASKDADAISVYVRALLPDNFIDHRTFKRLEALIDRFEKATLDGHLREAERSKRQLFESIRAGRRDGDVWKDIQDVMEQRRRLGEAEERRLTQNQSYLRMDQVMLLLRILISAFKDSASKYVSDREILQYILEEADRIYTRQLGLADYRQANQGAVDRHNLP